MPAARASSQFLNTTVFADGGVVVVVGVGVVCGAAVESGGGAAVSGTTGELGVVLVVPGPSVLVVGVTVGVPVVGCSVVGLGVSVRWVVVDDVAGCAFGRVLEVAMVGTVLTESPERNGFTMTTDISTSGITMMAAVITMPGPPYRPIGPRTPRPFSSTQNAQPRGGFGQVAGGRQRRGGRHRAVGGSGQPGGVLNCLT